MSDSLCGPSAPTKGLINQLDRDNSRHQTRPVARGPLDQNFRTGPEAANGSAKDAALNEFLVGPAGPPLGSLVPFPMSNLTPSASVGPASRSPFQIPQQGLQNQHVQGAPVGGAGRVSTDWVNDFRNMQLNHNQSSGSVTSGQIHPTYGPPSDHIAAHHPMPNHTANQFYNPYQQSGGPLLGATPQVQHGLGLQQQVSAAQGPAMAPSDQQALDDVFAELFADADKAYAAASETKTDFKTQAENEEARLRYEQNFQEEMDQWMAANGRSAEERDHQMNQDRMVDAEQHPDLLPRDQIHEQAAQHNEDNRPLDDDYQLRKAAQDIMTTLSTNQSEKFKNSTFIGLMNRIYQKEVVLQGNDLFDTTTGTVLGGENNINETTTTNTDDSKGKGKEKATFFGVEIAPSSTQDNHAAS